MTSLLSLQIFIPIVFGVFLLLLPNRSDRLWRHLALSINVLCLLLALVSYHHFDLTNTGMQLVEHHNWIPEYGVDWHLGVDGLSLAMIVLTGLTNVLVLIASYQLVRERVNQFLAMFLMMQGFMVAMFAAQNAMLFYVFWEAILIPMYLVIGVWGSSQRSYAAIKFFLYTFLGSVLMLLALLYLGHQANSMQIVDFYRLEIPDAKQMWLFIAFFMAFAVKIPMWPLHTWLPDAHTEAPAGGSMLLAAIMLKMGGYGFLRFILPILPAACLNLAWPMIGLSLVAIVYIGLVAIVQTDLKRLIAYSSIAHMGIVTLGLFIGYLPHVSSASTHGLLGLDGAMIQMISHGFSSAALFVVVGMLYERVHSRQIKDFSGLVSKMPVLTAFVILFAMTNAGLPGTSGFVGEFMVLLASFKANFWVAFAAGLTLILAAAYTLWMVKRVFWGQVQNPVLEKLQDVSFSERCVLILLALPILYLGLAPGAVLQLLQATRWH